MTYRDFDSVVNFNYQKVMDSQGSDVGAMKRPSTPAVL